jgi:YD repeat-containing protein
MTYDKENRMKEFFEDAVVHTFSYDGDGQKRSEKKNGVLSTLIWDGTDYLGEI